MNAARFTVKICSWVLGILWLWQGLVPKLLFKETGELAMVEKAGLFQGFEPAMVNAIGVAEILFGLALAVFPRMSLHVLNIAALFALAVGALLGNAGVYLDPFSPFTLSLAMMGLSAIAMVNMKAAPEETEGIADPQAASADIPPSKKRPK